VKGLWSGATSMNFVPWGREGCRRLTASRDAGRRRGYTFMVTPPSPAPRQGKSLWTQRSRTESSFLKRTGLRVYPTGVYRSGSPIVRGS
jgi:hypothetical protein